MWQKIFRLIFPLCVFTSLSLSFAAETAVPLRKSAYDLPVSSEPFRFIRVCLIQEVNQVEISSLSPYVLKNASGKVLSTGKRLKKTMIRPGAKAGIKIGTQQYWTNPLVLETQGEGFEVQNHAYRNNLKIWVEPGKKILVVNEIPFEEYMKGVLPSEVMGVWPEAVLKAQAIASRSFALFRMMENQKEKFDLKRDMISQMYKGKGHEYHAATRAVEETHGQILTYQGKVFPAFFHSTCGGYTANLADLWNMEFHPSMKGVRCSFCADSPHYQWTSRISVLEIEKTLKKGGYPFSGIREIRFENPDPGGRARFVTVVDRNRERKIRAADFRFLVDPKKIKSTLVRKIRREGNEFVLTGRGWGHGAGLCQYGAKKMAKLGYSCQQILDHYYPDSEITQFWPRSKTR